MPIVHEDFADLDILSQPVEVEAGGQEDMYEIMLSFSEGGPISRTFAETALQMLLRRGAPLSPPVPATSSFAVGASVSKIPAGYHLLQQALKSRLQPLLSRHPPHSISLVQRVDLEAHQNGNHSVARSYCLWFHHRTNSNPPATANDTRHSLTAAVAPGITASSPTDDPPRLGPRRVLFRRGWRYHRPGAASRSV